MLASLMALGLLTAACASTGDVGPAEAAAAAERAPALVSGDGVDAILPAAIGERGGDPARGAGNPTASLRQAMSFTAPEVTGKGLIDGESYLGKDLILWFWAPWCAWCNVEAPRVAQAAIDFEGQVEILGLAGVSNTDNMQHFVDRHDLYHINHVADISGEIWRGFDINYQPWWIFVNDDGTVLENWQGRLSDEEIAERVQRLIDS